VLTTIPADNPRTYGIIAVSVAALWYKAARWDEALAAVKHGLEFDDLRQHARDELWEIAQAIRAERGRS
jgi:transcription elongation factor GreA-like protein